MLISFEIYHWYCTLHMSAAIPIYYRPCFKTVPMDQFPRDVAYMRKFDYYSADHTWGGNHALLMYYVQWENPTSARIPACKLRLGIATRERPALFVEQRERFHLPFVASPYDLPSWRYSLLKITLSFQNAQSVPLC